MISAKEFFKKLKAIAKAKGLSGNYVPDPKGLTDERYFQAVKVGMAFQKDCSSVITGQEDLRKIVLAIQSLKDDSVSKLEFAGHPTIHTIASEEDKAVITTLFELLPKLNEMEAYAKAAWKAKIGQDEIKNLLGEMGE